LLSGAFLECCESFAPEEIRTFGTEIETLSNKTAIKQYHDNDFNHLLEVLKKNKNKLSVDPSSVKFRN
jgi:hypothetical protein